MLQRRYVWSPLRFKGHLSEGQHCLCTDGRVSNSFLLPGCEVTARPIREGCAVHGTCSCADVGKHTPLSA
jgi:hypothetical protein